MKYIVLVLCALIMISVAVSCSLPLLEIPSEITITVVPEEPFEVQHNYDMITEHLYPDMYDISPLLEE